MNLFYKSTLYPLQDKILKIVNLVDDKFYLTGGTALSRFHYETRYSDDLDFFVHNEKTFIEIVNKIINSFEIENKIKIDVIRKAENFVSVMVEKILKLDFVNDIGKHCGDFESNIIFNRIDNVQNILANKLTAIFARDEAKDIVDIWTICTHEKINWPEIYKNSSSKAVGIFPPDVAQRLETFPLSFLETIKWVKEKPEKQVFKKDINKIINEMLKI